MLQLVNFSNGLLVAARVKPLRVLWESDNVGGSQELNRSSGRDGILSIRGITAGVDLEWLDCV